MMEKSGEILLHKKLRNNFEVFKKQQIKKYLQDISVGQNQNTTIIIGFMIHFKKKEYPFNQDMHIA